MIGGRVANLRGRGKGRAPLSSGKGSRTSVVGGRVAHLRDGGRVAHLRDGGRVANLRGRGKGRAPP